ncbi:sugar ABC transporter ATP-binding protein [Streptomyces nigrescens]|uniref:Sugar ABC transporter ATP-binding protein n=1 Tax=Streptomyces nigrescens TaxID=1920 RepID=A0ABY7J0H6_STRNI|nr:sugar ABC transporter ATP-binding protein [Streptomyces nigrescens]WAU03807.1 sugar ABC transporter ATP-binding protein [Streptomyces nigrescens]
MASLHEGVPILEVRGLTKGFPNGTLALRGVDLRVTQGSVHGLVGANGAGKSTLIKCVSGVQGASSGSIAWRGEECSWRDPGQAQQAGLTTIHQHVPLVPTLTTLENVFLSRPGPWRLTEAMDAEFGALVERLGYSIDPDALVGTLPIGQRQMVAILQALAVGAALVIMDEPTASLSETERRIVLDAVRRLAASGTTFVFISHFLDEILEITDHVSVLRDGRIVLSETTATLSEERLVQSIAGRELLAVERAGSTRRTGTEEVLSVRNLNAPVGVRDVSFMVAAGEVVGLAGLLGSGRSEILNAVFGADRRARGDVRICGRRIKPSPLRSVEAGVAYVPEDRVQQGLHVDQPIWKNISLPDLGRWSLGRWFPKQQEERDRAALAISELGIVASGVDALPRELSGGNAQKVAFAKWLYADKRVWLLDEPTAGVDVGAKADLLHLVKRLADEGRAVVIACSDFEELLSVATRILVIRGGRVIADLAAEETNEEELIMLTHGLGPTARKASHV